MDSRVRRRACCVARRRDLRPGGSVAARCCDLAERGDRAGRQRLGRRLRSNASLDQSRDGLVRHEPLAKRCNRTARTADLSGKGPDGHCGWHQTGFCAADKLLNRTKGALTRRMAEASLAVAMPGSTIVALACEIAATGESWPMPTHHKVVSGVQCATLLSKSV